MDLAAPTVTIETITPTQAERYLEQNTQNRPVSRQALARYEAELREGRWRFNGDTIRFSGTRLLDGQHRLLAIVQTGIPAQAIVVRGLEDDVFDTIDTGRNRGGGDVLAINGEAYSHALASTLRHIWLYKTRSVQSQLKSFTNTLMQEVLEQHPDVRQFVRSHVNQSRTVRRLLPNSISAAYHYLFSYGSPRAADLFFEKLRTGADLSVTSPIYLLRQRYIDESLATGKSSTAARRMQSTARIALLIKCFNHYLENREIKLLRWGMTESFPEIQAVPPELVDSFAARASAET